MKRKGNLYKKIISKENLIIADTKARKGKLKQYGVQVFDKNKDANIDRLYEMLRDKIYHTSSYKIRTIFEPKERLIYCLPYFPDRIVHHAVMIHLEKIFVDMFTADTYSCIKGRGIHPFSFAIRKALKNVPGTQYCLKLDIRKFYPSIDHDTLKTQLRRKFKDPDLLWLLDDIIDSAPGVPIGNYLSQFFANFNLTPFDHWLKEQKKIKYYFRYADDMIFLSGSKEELHQLLADIREYLHKYLKLDLKDNYQIFLVESRGIDVGGYVIYHDCVYVRKEIKKSFARAMKKRKDRASIDSYMGWLKWANCKNLTKKILQHGTKKV